MRPRSFRRIARGLAVALLFAPLAYQAHASAFHAGMPAAPHSVHRAAVDAFDGTWLVVFTCPGARDGTAGYTRRFLAVVQGGALHGEIGVRNQAAYLALDGTIKPDGSALLIGTGMTGNPDYAVGRPSSATPYRFSLQTKFDGGRGTGQRVETRTCNAVFSRQ